MTKLDKVNDRLQEWITFAGKVSDRDFSPIQISKLKQSRSLPSSPTKVDSDVCGKNVERRRRRHGSSHLNPLALHRSLAKTEPKRRKRSQNLISLFERWSSYVWCLSAQYTWLEVTPLSPVCVGSNRFDVDGSGGINLEEFRQGMKSTGSSTSLTNDEVDLLFGLFDVDGSGTLELDEFESFSSANAR